MRKLLLITLFFIPVFAAGQMDMSMSYTFGNIMNVDMAFLVNGKTYLGAEIAGEIANGADGENMSTVGWNEFPEDIKEEGEYTEIVYNGCLGFKAKRLIMAGIIGVAKNGYYQNRYDEMHILGNNGNYHVLAEGDESKFNAGGKLKLVLGENNSRGMTIGLRATSQEGFGLSLGFIM